MKKPSPAEEPPALLTLDQVAHLAQVSRRTIHNWLASRVIGAIRIGRVLRFDREKFLEELAAFQRSAVR